MAEPIRNPAAEVPVATLTPNRFERGTPEWWLDRLGKQLAARQDTNGAMTKHQRYYDGDHPMPFATAKSQEAFGGLFKETPNNFMPVVIDTLVERCVVQGIRLSEPEGDEEGWRIWQKNGLDARSRPAFRTAFIKSEASMMVSPYRADWLDDRTPRITIEDPQQMIVELDGGDVRRRRAAMKVWEEDGTAFATLYLPDFIYKYQWDSASGFWSQLKNLFGMGGIPGWKRRQPDGDTEWPLRNPLGVVPVVPIVNKPDTFGNGESELRDIESDQDKINKTENDMLVSSEFAAFRQRYFIGVDIPVDPDTGQPVADFKFAVSRVLTLPGAPDGEQPVSVGEFDVTPLEPYLKVVESKLQHMALKKRMPVHYFLASVGMVPSGESLEAAETPLVEKMRDKHLDFSDSIEEIFRLAFRAIGDTERAESDSEVIWKDPAHHSPSEFVDSLVKEKALGVPDEFLWEKLKYSPQDIERIRMIRLRNALEGAVIAVQPVPALGPVTQLPQAARG